MTASAVTIGNFDGVHRGHAALLRATLQYARAHQVKPVVLTFHPHPTSVVAPERVPLMITSLNERIRLLKAAGMEEVQVLAFDKRLAALTAREFVQQTLVDRLHTRAVFVGESFLFGHAKSGTRAVMEGLGREFGFVAEYLPPVELHGHVLSSTSIRELLQMGRVNRARHLLGRCFVLEGNVMQGEGLGSRVTVPTLNLNPSPELLVPRGVFVTSTRDLDSDRRWHSITNCGTRPTFGGQMLTVETYLLSPFTPPAPAHIEVEFRHFVRDERQFPSPADLLRQIQRDVERARRYWRLAARFT